MAKRKINEDDMKNLLSEGFPYKPEQSSEVPSELRKAVLDEIEDVPVMKSAEKLGMTLSNEISPDEIQVRSKTFDIVPVANGTGITIHAYREHFLKKGELKLKGTFITDRETLQILRHILLDMESSTSLGMYINNILLDHILSYRELINSATSKKLRKQTIPTL